MDRDVKEVCFKKPGWGSAVGIRYILAMKTIVRIWPIALTIALIFSAASGAFIHPLWTTSAQTMTKVGGADDIHEAAWSAVIEKAKVDPYYRYAIYASRSLAVEHPEVYLKGDKLFLDIATKEDGYARAYSIKGVHYEYLYGRSNYPFNLTKDQLEKILKSMGINPVSVVYAYGNQTVTVPPAVVKPIIDGKYTPLDQLKYTEIGDKLPWKDKVKHEWDDSVQGKYVMFYQLNPEKQEPEWYIKLKHDEKCLYVLIEGVSDHEIGKVYKVDNIRKDSRQWFNFLFDTKNVGKSDPGTPGVYWLGLKFITDDQLGPLNLYGAKPPGNLLPKQYYKCSASLSESPISSIPHIIIESAFDLGLLTKYYDTIFFSSTVKNININLLRYQNDINLLGTEPILEFPPQYPRTIRVSDHFTCKNVSSRGEWAGKANRFDTTDPAVYVWWYLEDLTIGKTYYLRYVWIDPKNETYAIDFGNFTASLYPSRIAWAWMYIKGHEPERLPGEWRCEVYYREEGGEWAHAFTERFTIQGPPQGLPTGAGGLIGFIAIAIAVIALALTIKWTRGEPYISTRGAKIGKTIVVVGLLAFAPSLALLIPEVSISLGLSPSTIEGLRIPLLLGLAILIAGVAIYGLARRAFYSGLQDFLMSRRGPVEFGELMERFGIKEGDIEKVVLRLNARRGLKGRVTIDAERREISYSG